MTTEQKTLIAYHGDISIKEKYISRMKAHIVADELVQGIGWESNGTTKGCAVGCTLNNYQHASYETELGIPRIVAHLEDRIFEGLSVEDAKDFPLSFLEAIPVGADLSNIYKHFFIWMLTDSEDGVIKFAKTDQTKDAIQKVSDLLGKSLLHEVTIEEFRTVRDIARKAAAAAADAYAAAAAADVAYAAAAAAADVAYAAAAAAADVAYAAAAAADVAYAAAAAADDAAYAAYARKKHYSKMAAKLIELLKAA